MAKEAKSPEAAAVCGACRRALPRNAPAGLCPACLMQEGVRLATSFRPQPGAFVAPAAEELALLFPGFDHFEWIGQGGMGAVYKAQQPGLDRTVAIKILPPETAEDAEFTERFRREAATLARLDHPNIVKVFDFGQREGFAFFVMEFVNGADLSHRITKGPLPVNEVFAFVGQLCRALQHSHDRGVVHRDIKPANVLVTHDGHVKVADFGVARLVHPDGADEKLTRTRSTLGTPRYMAPEQMTPGRDIDHRADIYAVGVVLYEMLTGAVPAGSFDPPSGKNAALNPRVDDVVLRALSAEPERRFATASELEVSLREAIDNPAPTRQERVRTLALRALGVSLLAAALGVGGALLWTLRDRASTDLSAGSAHLPSMTSAPAEMMVLAGEAQSILIPGEPIVAIALAAARHEFGLVLRADGTLRAWGDNRFGQTNVPLGLSSVTAIAAGEGPLSGHVVALRSDGTVVGWGDNTFHQARPPPGLAAVTAIAAGELHTVALTREGRVVAWGNQSKGATAVPRDLPPAQGVAAGAGFSVALLSNGLVVAWGRNDARQCDVPDLPGRVVEIVSGAGHTLARLESGRVVAWGNNARGQCDVPTNLPVVAKIVAGGDASAAIDAHGKIYAWGGVPEGFGGTSNPVQALAIGSRTWAALVPAGGTGRK